VAGFLLECVAGFVGIRSRIEVQVTDYHADETVDGSPLRASEERKVKDALKSEGAVKAYGHCASANYIPALSRRVKDKVDKARARPNTDFDELWLLVCAAIRRWGGTGSTMISPAVISLDDMDAHIAPILKGSPFSRAFLLIAAMRFWSSRTDTETSRGTCHLPSSDVQR
jgi:hypothetical protein